MASDIKVLLRKLRRLGATVEPTKGGHVKVTRNGKTVVTYKPHGTIAPRNLKNTMANLVSSGVCTWAELEEPPPRYTAEQLREAAILDLAKEARWAQQRGQHDYALWCTQELQEMGSSAEAAHALLVNNERKAG